MDATCRPNVDGVGRSPLHSDAPFSGGEEAVSWTFLVGLGPGHQRGPQGLGRQGPHFEGPQLVQELTLSLT